MHLNSKQLFDKYAKGLFKPGMKVLEIGPDKHPSTYRRLIGGDTITWETVDIFDDGNLTYRAQSEYRFPVKDNSFDIVLSGQVIEHVRKPWVWMKEVARVCKTGGYVITIAPVNWPYHENPVDCWRMYPDGLRALYEDAGLTVTLCKAETIDRSLLKVSLKESSVNKGAVTFRSAMKRILTWPLTYSIIDTIAIGVKEGKARD